MCSSQTRMSGLTLRSGSARAAPRCLCRLLPLSQLSTSEGGAEQSACRASQRTCHTVSNRAAELAANRLPHWCHSFIYTLACRRACDLNIVLLVSGSYQSAGVQRHDSSTTMLHHQKLSILISGTQVWPGSELCTVGDGLFRADSYTLKT